MTNEFHKVSVLVSLVEWENGEHLKRRKADKSAPCIETRHVRAKRIRTMLLMKFMLGLFQIGVYDLNL